MTNRASPLLPGDEGKLLGDQPSGDWNLGEVVWIPLVVLLVWLAKKTLGT